MMFKPMMKKPGWEAPGENHLGGEVVEREIGGGGALEAENPERWVEL